MTSQGNWLSFSKEKKSVHSIWEWTAGKGKKVTRRTMKKNERRGGEPEKGNRGSFVLKGNCLVGERRVVGFW